MKNGRSGGGGSGGGSGGGGRSSGVMEVLCWEVTKEESEGEIDGEEESWWGPGEGKAMEEVVAAQFGTEPKKP